VMLEIWVFFVKLVPLKDMVVSVVPLFGVTENMGIR